MASFIKTGALVRRTHRPFAIFLSRPLYLYEQCRRLLQSSHEILIEAQTACDEQARHIDVLCFSKSDTDRAVQPVDLHADESDTNRAVQPVALEADAENNEEADVENILSDSGAPNESHADHEDTDSAAEADESEAMADINNEDAQPASETLDDGVKAEAFEEDLEITALEGTTSAHDD